MILTSYYAGCSSGRPAGRELASETTTSLLHLRADLSTPFPDVSYGSELDFDIPMGNVGYGPEAYMARQRTFAYALP